MAENELNEWLYFLENEAWYQYDYEIGEYKLTDKATPEAVKSYNDYLKSKELQKKIYKESGRYFT